MGIRILISILILQAAFLSCGDGSYNCHGYVWGQGWIDVPPLKDAQEVESGPIVVYFQNGFPVHSGFYLGHGWVLSKWGSNPLMIHPIWLTTYGWNWRFYEYR